MLKKFFAENIMFVFLGVVFSSFLISNVIEARNENTDTSATTVPACNTRVLTRNLLSSGTMVSTMYGKQLRYVSCEETGGGYVLIGKNEEGFWFTKGVDSNVSPQGPYRTLPDATAQARAWAEASVK